MQGGKVPKQLGGKPVGSRDPLLVDKLVRLKAGGSYWDNLFREHLQVMLENAFTLPRHSERNASLADSIGKRLMTVQ